MHTGFAFTHCVLQLSWKKKIVHKSWFQSPKRPSFMTRTKQLGKVKQVERSDLAGWTYWVWLI